MLRVRNTQIIDRQGRSVVLKGVNLGGWLMMEAYILHAPNRAVKYFKENFRTLLGKKALADFEQNFHGNFIRESDFAQIARLGLNCVRVPFHHALVELKPYKYDPHGATWLDKVIAWGKKHKLYVILDLHGACGSQNTDWHADSSGKAELWTNKSYQERTAALWGFLADRYKDEEWVAGYDILNEAVTDDVKTLNNLYRRVIKAIRRVDRNHILFIEGNTWAQDLEAIDPVEDDNYALSVHSYVPNEFVFNFVPQLSYPLKEGGYRWNRESTRKHLAQYKEISRKRSVPIFLGEFGVNARGGVYHEEKWVADVLACCREFDFHWTYWTYKSVKNSICPDGLYTYMPNPPWVNRAGPLCGWDTYHLHWKKYKKEMIRSWHTDQFQPNTPVLKVLKQYAR